MQDSVTPNGNLETTITFATVCEVCGLLIPGIISYPCSTGFVVIPRPFQRDWEAEAELRKAPAPTLPQMEQGSAAHARDRCGLSRSDSAVN